MHATTTFPADIGSPRLARRWLSLQLPGTVPRSTCDDALLLLSELVSNAVQHAKSPCRVAIDLTSGYLLVEVADETSLGPEVALRDMAETGRGIAVVDRLASDWGWRLVEGGKVVWIKLELAEAGADALGPRLAL